MATPRIRFAENQPEFAELPYEAQLTAKRELLKKDLQGVPEYEALPSGAKAVAFNTLFQKYSTPVYENKEFGAAMHQIADMALNGDNQSMMVLSSFLTNNSMSQNSIIANAVNKLLQGANRLIGEGADDPRQRAWAKAYEYTTLTGSDPDKFRQWLSHSATNNPEAQDKLKRVVNLTGVGGNILGLGTDLAVFNLTAGAAVSGWATKAGTTLAQNLGKTGTWLARTVMPAAVDATAEAAFGLVRENLLAYQTGDESRYTKTTAEIAKTMGLYAAEDFLMGTALGTLVPFFGASLGKIFRKGKQIERIATDADFEQFIRANASDLPAGQREVLTDFTNDLRMQRQEVAQLKGRINELNALPREKLMVEAASQGAVARRLDDGRYRLHNVRNGNVHTEIYDNLLEARKGLSDVALDNYLALSSRQQKRFLSNPLNRDLIQPAVLKRAVDIEFDPLKNPNLSKSAEKNIRSMRYRGYVPETDRPYVSRAEANAHLKASKGTAIEVDLDINDARLSRLRKGENLFDAGRPRQFKNTEGNPNKGLLIVNKMAPQEDVALSADLARKIKQKNPDLPETLEQVQADILLSKGYDAYMMEDSVISLMPERVKAISMAQDARIAKVREAEVMAKPIIEGKVTGELTGKQLVEDREAFATVMSGFYGDINADDVAKLSRLYLGELGVDGSQIKVVKKAGNSVDVDIGENQVVLRVPNKIETPQAQSEFAGSYLKALEDIGEAKGTGAVKRFRGKYNDLLQKSRASFDMPFMDPVTKRKWVHHMIATKFGGELKFSGNKATWISRSGRQVTADSVDQLLDEVMLKTMDRSSLQAELARAGYNLKQVPGGFVVTGKGLSKPVRGSSLTDIMDKINYRPAKMDNAFAPASLRINDDVVQIGFEGDVAVGNRSALLRFIDKFEDKFEMQFLKKVASIKNQADIFSNPSGTYKLQFRQAGIVEEFKTMREARDFIRRFGNYDVIHEQAMKKGLTMSVRGNAYRFVDADGNELLARNTDEIKEIFRRYPDPDGANEIFDELDPAWKTDMEEAIMANDWTGIPRTTDQIPADWPDIMDNTNSQVKRSLGLKRSIQRATQQTTAWMEGYAGDTGDKDFLRLFRQTEDSRRIRDSKINFMRDRLENDVFKTPTGQRIKLDRRRAIMYHAGAQTDEELEWIVKEFGELSNDEKQAMGRLRTIYDSLADEFGITEDKFILNYMPRMRAMFEQMPAHVVDSTTNGAELFKKARLSQGKKRIPRHIEAFFEKERTSEILSFAIKDDPLEVTMRYAQKGYDKLYMDDAFNQLFRRAAEAKNPELMQVLSRYREKVLGSYHSPGEELVKSIGEAFFKKLGMDGKDGASFLRSLYTLNYMTNMSYRPWLAIRNSFQVYTTLAPRMGNDYVTRAVKALRKGDVSDDIYRYLEEIGVIRRGPPVMGEVSGFDTFLGRASDKGMKWFTNSDAFTRATAFMTAKIRLDEAIDKFKRGVLKSQDELRDYAGLNLIAPDEANRIMELTMRSINNNDVEAYATARNIFGNRIQHDTMFDYSSVDAPMTRDGLIGKLFGQYGTYSIGYRANLFRGLKHGSTKDKLAFMSRFVGNQAALWGAFSMLGINAQNFIPFAPAMFSGGPLFDLAISAMNIADVKSYEGRQARGEILGKMTQLLPGSLHVKYMKDFFKYMEEDDPWRAFLALTTTPTRSTRDLFGIETF